MTKTISQLLMTFSDFAVVVAAESLPRRQRIQNRKKSRDPGKCRLASVLNRNIALPVGVGIFVS
jgi:hypothetical protein